MLSYIIYLDFIFPNHFFTSFFQWRMEFIATSLMINVKEIPKFMASWESLL